MWMIESKFCIEVQKVDHIHMPYVKALLVGSFNLDCLMWPKSRSSHAKCQNSLGWIIQFILCDAAMLGSFNFDLMIPD